MIGTGRFQKQSDRMTGLKNLFQTVSHNIQLIY